MNTSGVAAVGLESGALTERAFVENLTRIGFADARVRERVPCGPDDLAGEPTVPGELWR